MNQIPQTIPVALQHQILMRTALAALSLVLAISLLLFAMPVAAVPFLLTAVLLAAGAGYIYWAAVNGRILELKGVILKLEQTAFHRRSKALLLEIEGKAVRVVLRNRHKTLRAGDQVTLFILDDTQLHSWRGLLQLDSYLSLTTVSG